MQGCIEHVIFDLDGTIVDSSRQILGVLNAMLAERGCADPIDPIGARQHMSAGGLNLVSALLGEWCGEPEAELADFRARYVQCQTGEEDLYPGVSSGIAQLRAQGLSLAICSNKPQELCEKVLGDAGLRVSFDVIVGGCATLRPKPHPDMLDEALARLGASPNSTLFVGDSELDHRLALGRDVPFLFVTYGYAQPGWRPDNTPSFDGFDDLTQAILGQFREAAHA